MAKLQIIRQSGEIVDEVNREKYQAEWRSIYDRIEQRVTEIHQNKSHKLFMVPAHILTNRFCNFMERQLYKKYAKTIEHEIPKSSKAWTKLIEQYQDTPIMIARRMDGKGVVMILMDTLSSGV